MISVMVLAGIVGFFFWNKKRKQSTEEEESESILDVLSLDEADFQVEEEFPTKPNEIFIYASPTVKEQQMLLKHTISFLESYVYPKKTFQRLSIEEQIQSPKPSVVVYTDSSEEYTLTFNEKYRVIGFKKKEVHTPFVTRISDKSKYKFFVDEKKMG
jgi:hypothetical protein